MKSVNISGIPFDAELNGTTGQYDRVSFAADVAKYFASVVSNGIVTPGESSMYDQFRVEWYSGMQVLVNPGSVIINGRVGWEESDQILTLDVGGVQPRIDIIVAELDITSPVRAFSIKVINGAESPTPVAPLLVRTDDVYQLELASISVVAGTSVLSQAKITDQRYNDALCGFSKSLTFQEYDDENNLLKYNRSVAAVDANNWPTTVLYKRPVDNSNFLRRVMTNPDGNGFYQTITETFYKADGVTAYKTIVYTLTYLTNGLINTMTRVVS